MMLRTYQLRVCKHEAEIHQALLRGQWPVSCAPELRAHAESCRSCQETILLTQAFRGARAVSAGAAQLPPPGVLWWRAQLRRRNAAVERINRPLLGAQIFAFAVTLLVAAGFFVLQAKDGWHWFSSLGAGVGEWFGSLPQSPAFHLEVLWSSTKSGGGLMYLVSGLAMLALASGVVMYLTGQKE